MAMPMTTNGTIRSNSERFGIKNIELPTPFIDCALNAIGFSRGLSQMVQKAALDEKHTAYALTGPVQVPEINHQILGLRDRVVKCVWLCVCLRRAIVNVRYYVSPINETPWGH